MKKSYLIVGLVIVVIGIVLFTGGTDETANNADTMEKDEAMMEDKTQMEENAMSEEDGAMMQEVVVIYTSEGFSPAKVTVKKGDKVTFRNNSTAPMWTATAIHPTHRVYPGSDIEKCGTPEETKIFDACRGIPSGSSYAFTFNEVGTWNYHDHLNLGKYGSIVVEAQ